MASLQPASDIDWTQCELIECLPGKVSGRPVVLTVAQIERLIEFAHSQRQNPVAT
jgi:hypothetical protein